MQLYDHAVTVPHIMLITFTYINILNGNVKYTSNFVNIITL